MFPGHRLLFAIHRSRLHCRKKGKEYWLDSELLFCKTKDPHYKNRIVLFDVLQAGKYLIHGPTVLERMDILSDICGNPTELESKHGLALVASENIWLAETFSHENLVKEFKRHLDKDEIEGLVIKKGNSKIDKLGKRYYEVSWQIRCRKPHKNYNF